MSQGPARSAGGMNVEPAADQFSLMLARARRGDPAAMAGLVERYEPELRLIARVRLGAALRPYLDSVDLVQSVHHSIMAGVRGERFQFSGPEQLVALALTIVRRKVARHWRRLRRQQRLDSQRGSTESTADLLASLSSPDLDPARDVDLKERLERVLSEMPPLERRVCELRLDGHSTAEVARLLDLDADVLRVRLSRLRQRLRDSGVLTEWL